MEISKVSKSLNNFYCEYCDYTCCRKSDFNKHLLTDKHNVSKDGNQMETVEIAKSQGQKEMKCDCGKIYKNKSGLWKHQKKCKFSEENTKPSEENITIEINEVKNPEIPQQQPQQMNESLIIEFIKQNQELKKIIRLSMYKL